MTENYSDDDDDDDDMDDSAEREEAYREWQQARILRERNPLPGYQHHRYGCGCEGCGRWYRSLSKR